MCRRHNPAHWSFCPEEGGRRARSANTVTGRERGGPPEPEAADHTCPQGVREPEAWSATLRRGSSLRKLHPPTLTVVTAVSETMARARQAEQSRVPSPVVRFLACGARSQWWSLTGGHTTGTTARCCALTSVLEDEALSVFTSFHHGNHIFRPCTWSRVPGLAEK